MRMFLIAIIVVVVSVFLIKRHMTSGEEDVANQPLKMAKRRVESMMDGWKHGGTSADGAAQEAVCQWYRGTHTLDRDELEAASDGFDRWRMKNSLYRSIHDYEVGEMLEVQRKKPYVSIKLDIDGHAYRIGVPEDDSPIFWVEP